MTSARGPRRSSTRSRGAASVSVGRLAAHRAAPAYTARSEWRGSPLSYWYAPLGEAGGAAGERVSIAPQRSAQAPAAKKLRAAPAGSASVTSAASPLPEGVTVLTRPLTVRARVCWRASNGTSGASGLARRMRSQKLGGADQDEEDRLASRCSSRRTFWRSRSDRGAFPRLAGGRRRGVGQAAHRCHQSHPERRYADRGGGRR